MENTKGDVDGIVAKLNKIHIKMPLRANQHSRGNMKLKMKTKTQKQDKDIHVLEKKIKK